MARRRAVVWLSRAYRPRYALLDSADEMITRGLVQEISRPGTCPVCTQALRELPQFGKIIFRSIRQPFAEVFDGFCRMPVAIGSVYTLWDTCI